MPEETVEPGGERFDASSDPEQPTADSADRGDATESPAPDARLHELTEELESFRDRAMRTQAELENYRRRVQRELDETRQYAAMPLLRDTLPVVDNIARAIEAAEKANESPALLEGFRMVSTMLVTVLQQHGCLEIEALHQPFDPNLHEAVLQQPSKDHPPGTVVSVVQPGYRLHDRVVRPSQVIVSSEG